LSPVARQQACPFRIAEQWERLALGVVSGAGCIRDVSVCQHPIFNFRFAFRHRRRRPGTWNSETQKRFAFQRLASVFGVLRRRGLQRWAGYMDGLRRCQQAKTTKSSFSPPTSSGDVHRRAAPYIARAR